MDKVRNELVDREQSIRLCATGSASASYPVHQRTE
jgi:hypothetical protein